MSSLGDLRAAFRRRLIEQAKPGSRWPDLPMSEALLRVAAELYVEEALTLAHRDRRWVLARLLTRYRPTLKPNDVRSEMFELLVIEELVELRMIGCEPPLGAAVVRLAVARMYVQRVLTLAQRDRRWVLSWLLHRYLSTLRPA